MEIAFYRNSFDEETFIKDREEVVKRILEFKPIVGVFESYEEDPEQIGAILHVGHDGWNLFIPVKGNPDSILSALNGIFVSWEVLKDYIEKSWDYEIVVRGK